MRPLESTSVALTNSASPEWANLSVSSMGSRGNTRPPSLLRERPLLRKSSRYGSASFRIVAGFVWIPALLQVHQRSHRFSVGALALWTTTATAVTTLPFQGLAVSLFTATRGVGRLRM